MNTNIFRILKKVSLLVAVLFLPAILFAQDPGGGPDAPIDGGISILIAAGIGYGVKKVRENRKKKLEEHIKD